MDTTMPMQPINDELGWDSFLQKYEHRMSPDDQQAFEVYLSEEKIDIDTASMEMLEAALTDWKEDREGASLDYDEEDEEWRST